MFTYITDTLYKNHNTKIGLLMFGKKTEQSKFKDDKGIVNVSRNNDVTKIFLNTYNRCLLSFERIPPTTFSSKNLDPGERILFSQKSHYDLDLALSICIEWLKSKHYKYLFNINSDGKVKGLGNAPPYHPVVYKNNNEFIRFKPAVIRGIDNILYEGIGIVTHKGHFISYTCNDFFSMASIIKNYILNSYNNNLQLLQLGINIYSQIK